MSETQPRAGDLIGLDGQAFVLLEDPRPERKAPLCRSDASLRLHMSIAGDHLGRSPVFAVPVDSGHPYDEADLKLVPVGATEPVTVRPKQKVLLPCFAVIEAKALGRIAKPALKALVDTSHSPWSLRASPFQSMEHWYFLQDLAARLSKTLSRFSMQ